MKKAAIPWEKLHSLKKLHKLIILVAMVVIAGVVFYFVRSSSETKITAKETAIDKLHTQIRDYRKSAIKIKQIEKELQDVRLAFENTKRFLPEKKEVDNLLDQISEKGASSGVKVVLIQPAGETKKDFYVQIPFDLKLEAPYLNLAMFFDSMALMDRIVNINDLLMDKPKYEGDEVVLSASCKAMTFRFMTEEEIEKLKEAEQAKKKGKRRRK